MKIIIIILAFLFSNHIAQDSIYVQNLYPGIDYKFYLFDGDPIRIHVLEVDLENEDVNIEVGIANNQIGHGGQLTSNFVSEHQSDSVIIVGAVNGDFFGGNPHSAQNCMIIQGEYAKGVKLNRSLLGITSDRKPFAGKIQFIGKLVYDEDTVNIANLNKINNDYQPSMFNKFYGDTIFVDSGYVGFQLSVINRYSPNQWIECFIKNKYNQLAHIPIDNNESVLLVPINYFAYEEMFEIDKHVKINLGTVPHIKNIYSLIGGLPRLLIDGERFDTYLGAEGLTSEGFVNKNPRTAAGFSKDNSKLFIVVADGRQDGFSIGMTLIELAEFLLSIGCYQAVNLDGGGSSTMVIDNRVMNSPSDKTGERPVHNFLYVTYKP